MKNITGRQQFVYFQSMDEIPERAKDLAGNLEDISISVLAYDKELDVRTIAWYNYDTKDWMDHSDDSLEFSFWCYLPPLNNFIASNPDLLKVKNAGYVDGIDNNSIINQIKKYIK